MITFVTFLLEDFTPAQLSQAQTFANQTITFSLQTLTITGGTVLVAQSSSMQIFDLTLQAGTLQVSNSHLTIRGVFSFSSGTIQGNPGAVSTLTFIGQMFWSGGALDKAFLLQNNGTLTISTSGVATINDAASH